MVGTCVTASHALDNTRDLLVASLPRTYLLVN
jgi:hypothetical protein